MSDEQNRKQHSNYQHNCCNHCCTFCFFHSAHSRPVISCNCCTHRKAQSRCGLSQNPSSVLHCLSACLSPQAAYGKSFRTFQARFGQIVNAREPMPPSVKKPVFQFALSAADHSAACFASAICFAASSDTASVPPNTVTLPAFLAFMNCFCAWFRLSDTSSIGALFSAA